jgi:hypothetical protein
MISLGVNAKQPQAFVGVLFDSGASFEHENTYRRWPVSNFAQNCKCLP